MNYIFKRAGKPEPTVTKHHERIAFDVFEYGITKRRLWVGDSEDSDEWQVGHPILFPNILSVGEPRFPQFQIRVPMDDTHTYHVWYRCKATPDGSSSGQSPHAVPVLDYAYKEQNGRLIVETVSGQDMMVWVTQGPISDRTTERLGTTDQGVILYRNLLLEQITRVERGEDPLAVIRDAAKNTPMVQIHRESEPFRVSAGDNDAFAARRERGTAAV
jgi:5,5'-dehydrodivanillate O-demethylase